MEEQSLRRLLEDVRSGALSPDDAVFELRRLPFVDLGFARVDHHRALRQQIGEAVYAAGKTPWECAEIVQELLDHEGGPVLVTRAEHPHVDECCSKVPGGEVTWSKNWATICWRPNAERDERVLVVTAGTSDAPVAAECVAVMKALGLRPRVLSDCGVAGVHRLLPSVDELMAADAVVVIAGMEGALASLVGGLTPAPIVAVPTSAGYGASLGGVTALLAMHASCAAGVTVVGIDNGFGAACAVVRMLR